MSIEWSTTDLQKHIDEILHSERLVHIEYAEDLKLYLFTYPNRRALQLSEMEYEKTVFRAKKDHFKTEEEMMEFMTSQGIWTDKDVEKAEETRTKIKKWSEKIDNPDISEQAKIYASQLIEKLEEDLWSIELKKERMLLHTVERKSRQAKYDYLLWHCTYNPVTMERLSKNNLTFYEDVEGELRNLILAKFLDYLAGHTTEEIRYIARNNLWRVNYVSATKANMPLFPCSIVDLSPDQLNLVWWSSYYQSIYEMLPDDQPEDWVIEDDQLLDKHMEDLHRERSKDSQTRRAEKKYGTRTAMKMQEALVFQSHPDYERMQYDQVPDVMKTLKKGQTDVNLKDDPKMKGERRKKSQSVSKSRRYSPDDKKAEK